jgi:hypothetical protein
MSTNAVLRSFETVALSLNWGSLSPTVSMVLAPLGGGLKDREGCAPTR